MSNNFHFLFLYLNNEQSYETYLQVLGHEPENRSAKKSMEKIKKQLPELPPSNAFR